MTRYITLPEFYWLAEQVTGLDTESLARTGRVDLADSALHAPQASFGGQDFYPELVAKAAALACHLAWNHPLPDGNKRSCWASLVMFLDLNGIVWDPDPPDVDDAETAVLVITTHDHDARSRRSLLRGVAWRPDQTQFLLRGQRISAADSGVARRPNCRRSFWVSASDVGYPDATGSRHPQVVGSHFASPKR